MGRVHRDSIRRARCGIVGGPLRRRSPRGPNAQRPGPLDDEQHIRLLIEQALEELEDDGVELLSAPDGEVALDVVRNQSPQLVFLDVTMPKMNGFNACATIKHELGLTDTFVCMLTAKGQAYDRERGLEAALTCS